MTRREKAILALLKTALEEITSELYAAGAEEVEQHITLRHKRRFVEQTWRRIEKWERE